MATTGNSSWWTNPDGTRGSASHPIGRDNISDALKNYDTGEQRQIETPFVNLSDSLYDDIIGEQEYKRRGAVKGRTSELESAYRTKQGINQARQLII